jgi:hypothetical protein
MNAREMFKKLGYSCIKSDRSIWYINDSDFENYGSIEFWFCDCTFEVTGSYGDPLMVNVKELEAIIQQCKELGWIEDEKQETNYEYFKDEIIENCGFTFALVGGKPHKCACVNCNDCGFSTGHGCTEKIKEWLKKPHEKPVYKLTKFEKELLQCYPDIYSFKVFNSLNGMKEKGYFKGIDDNEIIGDILANCEVIE